MDPSGWPLSQEILWTLDAIGTVAFAASGALKAIRHRLDLLGLLVLGYATAMGGGLLRDALIHRTPHVFVDPAPALFALLGCALAAAWHRLFHVGAALHLQEARGERAFLVVDALGLAVFAATGARVGTEAGLNTFGVVLLAAITGAGGGMIRDVLVREVPLVLKADVYATAALLGGFTTALLRALSAPAGWNLLVSFAATLTLRLLALWRGWRLPKL